MTTKPMTWKDWILSCVYGPIMIYQFWLAYVNYNNMGLDWMVNFGWLVFIISGIFGWLPIYTFKKKGGVPKGKGYMETTTLVDTGIYSIVRHPQYLAGILIIVSIIMITQYWLSTILGIIAIVFWYVDVRRADPRLVEKFGEDYVEYMQRVPAINAIVGILRLLKK